MVRSVCCVPGCPKNSTDNPDLDYHHLPCSDVRRRKWLENMGSLDIAEKSWRQVKGLKICGAHFEPDQYRSPLTRKLNIGAIPTIFVRELPETSQTFDLKKVISTNISNILRTELRESPDLTVPAAVIKTEELQEFVKIPTIELPETNQTLDLKKIISTTISNILRTELRELPDLTVPATVLETELQEFVKIPTIKSEILPGNSQGAVPTIPILPSVQSLNRCNIVITPGINDALFADMNTVSQKLAQVDKYCILMFDEISLADGLSFNYGTDIIEGLVDSGTHRTSNIPNHALVFMIRGVRSKWKQAIAFYLLQSASNTCTLKSCIQQVVRAIHSKTELRVVASVSDLATNHRCAVRSLSEDYEVGRDYVYNIDDYEVGRDYVYNIDGTKIYHLFDAPHCIKCLRNNFITNDIIYNGKRASWRDIKQLYAFDGTTVDSKVTKLTANHVDPKGEDKLRVKYAVQVFSRCTFGYLTLLSNAGAMNARDTAEFILFVNDLFDSLNCVNQSPRPLAAKLCDNSPHFEFWYRAERIISELKFVNDNNTEPTPATLQYVTYTIRNIQSLWHDLKHLGFDCLHTKTLNQDPLENFLAVIRDLCEQNSNPTCSQFVSAFRTCIINSTIKSSKESNCEDDGCYFLLAIDHFVPSN